ncbi:MAG: endonuclease Q family protein [Patescibacteria group bacterium]|nr:endonuclease Q family protein [Patescibacteria group bacterium]
MEYIADLHVHSKYSRAVSQDMVLPTMALWAKKKGLDILPIPDWTHPLWIREVRNQLEEKSDGLFKLKSQISNLKSTSQNSKLEETEKETLFILSTEISSIYSQGGRARRVHNLVLVPGFETVEKISKELIRRGCNLSSDGRPIIGISSKNLLEMVLGIDENAFLIPCHIWTPWFSMFGSNSGFNSIEECFGDYSKYIYGIETGLSSDPDMNWRIKELETRSILSSSDSHSPMKMGREATVFITKGDQTEIGFKDIKLAVMQKSDKLKIGYTIEFHPEEGKYHYTGHRNCKFVQSPEDSRKLGTICPVCHKPLTVGVMHRVDELADKSIDYRIKVKNNENGIKWICDPTGKHPPFVRLVPLVEIIAESMGSTVSSIKVKILFDELCEKLGSENKILLRHSIEEIKKQAGEKIAEGVLLVRGGNIVVEPGFDGEYGKVKIWSDPSSPEKKNISQMGLDF